ncbi:phospholipid phosphatase-related protein type 5-like [Aplochiton taeniatus]
MLYFQLVLMVGVVILTYYFEHTDTFRVRVQGFLCGDPAYSKPYLGPEREGRLPPALVYTVLGSLPVLLISGVESVLFLLQYVSQHLNNREKIIVMGDCCYLNPLLRRTSRFLGGYMFGIFVTDIFVNAGQLMTGRLSPYFLSVCKPNYTVLGCQETVRFISQSSVCTGNSDDITHARKSFPCKDAALSFYAALYLGMYICCAVQPRGVGLARPLLCLVLLGAALLTGLNRVVEYRNHWPDVIAGFTTGGAMAVVMVVAVLQKFKGKLLLDAIPPEEGVVNVLAPPHIHHTLANSGTRTPLSLKPHEYETPLAGLTVEPQP